MIKMVKALCLMSGGLDSILTVKILQSQGIETIGLCFETPFFNANNAKIAANNLNIELIIQDLTDEHLEMVKKPRYGYGKNMNPCIDCHGLMLTKAKIIAQERGIDIIATGEVLGQRPMSQNLTALKLVAKLAGLENKVLRPLSAKLLTPTDYENDNLVNRSELLDFSGKNRKPQLALAEQYSLSFFPTPSGGCKLTEKEFSVKLKLLLQQNQIITPTDLKLLSIGRHIWHNEVLLIITRNQLDTEKLKLLSLDNYFIMKLVNITGPAVIALFVNENNLEEIKTVAMKQILKYKHNLNDIQPVFKYKFKSEVYLEM